MKKRVLIVVLILLFILALSVVIFSKIQVPTTREERVDDFLESVKSEIKLDLDFDIKYKNFAEIDDSLYDKLFIGEAIEIKGKSVQGFNIAFTLEQLMINAPINSTYPILFISQDAEKVGIAYKEEDGTSVFASCEVFSMSEITEFTRSDSDEIIDINEKAKEKLETKVIIDKKPGNQMKFDNY